MPLGTQPQLDWAAGMFRGVARNLIPPNGMFDARNALTDDDGSLYRRGGSIYKSGAAFSANGLRWLWDGYLVPGQRTVFADSADFGVLAADDSAVVNLGGAGSAGPVKPAVIDGLMFIPGGTIYGGSRKSANYSTGTITVTNGSKVVTGAGTTWNTLVDAGMLLRVGGAGRYYVIESVDSVTQVTLSEAYEGATAAGQAYVFSPLGSAASAPYRSSQMYVAGAGRLFSLEGDKIFFSAWGNPHSWAATDYQQLPGGVQILGGEFVRDLLLVFTTDGLWALSNLQLEMIDDAANPQQRVEQITHELVLWGPAGIADFDNARVVPCVDGAYLVDGVSRPVLISRSIERLYREYVRAGYSPGRAVTYRAHYFLPILNGANEVVDLLVCRLNRAIETGMGDAFPWTRFDGHGGNVAAFAVRIGLAARQPLLLGASRAAASRVLDCSAFFEPAAAVKNDADGSTHQFDLVTRDYPTGDPASLVRNLVRRLRCRYELIAAPGDDPTLLAYYSVGTLEGDVSLWGTFLWGTDPWSDIAGAEFVQLPNQAPADDGRRPFAWRLQARTRIVRYRLISTDPAARLVIRSLESVVRPSPKL